MDWQYSNPLGSALIAANSAPKPEFGSLGQVGTLNTSLYDNYYTGYDPLISRYKARANIYRPNASIDLFDDIDDLALEVEANSLLTPTRFRQTNIQPSTYLPSYYDADKNFSSNSNNNNNNNINKNKVNNNRNQFNQIPQRPPGLKNSFNNNNNNNVNKGKPQNRNNNNNKQNSQPAFNQPNPQDFANPELFFQPVFQPIPFNQQNINSPIHNNQQQRFLQYQNRIQQQQQQQQQQFYAAPPPPPQAFNVPTQNNSNNNFEGLSEIEALKKKQQQDRHQLLAAIAANGGARQNYGASNQFDDNNNNHNMRQHLNNKQYSESSIPSTSADPLSNSPTPPIAQQRNGKKNNLNLFNNNNNRFNNQKPYEDPNDPGSYLNTLRETRLREQRLAKDKYTSNDYKHYAKNFGFGRDFLPFEAETKQEKSEKAKKREEYARLVKERNDNQKFTKLFQPNNIESQQFREPAPVPPPTNRNKIANDFNQNPRVNRSK